MPTPTADQVFSRGIDVFDVVVSAVGDARWDAPSACAGWTCRDVLGHVGQILEFGIAIFEGRQPAPPVDDASPGSVVSGPPFAYWAPLAQQAQASLPHADLQREVDSPIGRRAIADGLAFPAVDLFVYAWDIASVNDFALVIPDDVIRFAHAHIDPLPQDRLRSPAVFGPQVVIGPDAGPSNSFLAFTGRTPKVARRPTCHSTR